MKTFKKIMIGILSVCMLFLFSAAVGCTPNNPPAPSGYTVTFMVEGQQYGNPQTVQRGRRVAKPEDPTFSEEGYVFTGWFTTETFDEGTAWNFNTGIVTTDITLYAGYRIVNNFVAEITKANEPVTSKLTWTQSAASNASDYTVIITDSLGNPTTLTGSVEFDADNYRVTFTPSTIPQGGIYTVSIKDNTKTAEACVVENVMFNGAGTQSNPYLIASELDFTAVNQANVAKDTYFSLTKSISINTNRDSQKDYDFNGVLLGNGRTITVTGNSAAIYKIGQDGYVKQVTIAGAISTSLYDSVGAMVDYNAGKVEKISVTANVESTAGVVGTSGLENAINETLTDGSGSRGIAGGVVGTNLSTGIVYNCKITSTSSSTGTIKARIGGGTIVGYNKGKVELCTSEGCLGAWNSKETGKSTSNYSYAGGIVGINAGTVTQCAVVGSGKLLGQRISNEGSIVKGTTNINIGGIVGYNMENATVSESYFAGIRVHGDENVGGIAGLNAGSIANCYVAGVYNSTTAIYSYVGGRTNVGGIAGKSVSGSTVSNCFVTANVYAYGTSGIAYAVSENANNVVYLSANLNAKSADDKNTNPNPASLVEPNGTGNVKIEVVGGSCDGVTTDYELAETYLATINGDNKFFFNTTIKLNFINNVLPEETMQVVLYDDEGTLIKEVEVAETGAAIAGPTKKGYVFVGWATEKNGEIVFAKGSSVSLYDLLDYTSVDGKASLYAVMQVRVPNEGLIVAVYDRYIDKLVEGSSAAIESAFKEWMKTKNYTYSVEFRHYTGDSLSVANFGEAVNSDADIDVIIGAGSNITSTGKVEYIARSYMTYEGLTARYACLLTDTERAIDFYAFVTGLEAGTANVTFNVKGEPTTGEVDNVLGITVTAPDVVAESGYEFIGWATTENATVAQVSGSKIGYADVKELLNDGAVVLYPVFAEKQVDLVVYIHLSAPTSVYITETEADAIESAIATLYAGKNVSFVRIEGKNAAGFVSAISDATNVDIYIGGNKADGLTFDSEYGKAAAGAGHFENTSRKVGIIDGCANKETAIALYQYLTANKVVE